MVYQYTQRILGKLTASLLTSQLEASPDVLTANHQGLDCYSQTIQGTLLFALSRIMHPQSDHPFFPVLACGNAPLHNLTFPRGILLARHIKVHTGPNEPRQTAIKIPIFPSRFQNTLVCQMTAYTPKMLQTAHSRTLAEETGLLSSEKKAVLNLLDRVYPAALQYTNSSDQCVALNSLAWKELFARELHAALPIPVYLELEKVSTRLLKTDLCNERSLINALLFDPRLRTALLQILDGHTGCWSLQHLQEIRSGGILLRDQGMGTLFFWTTDHKGRKLPMDIVRTGGTERLIPLGLTPKTRGIDWTPTGLTEALKAGHIFPSLLVSFTVLALARGLVCHEGIYQAEYLPGMQQGVMQALQETGRKAMAKEMATLRTDAFIAGQNVAMARYPDGSCAPAGTVEIMAGGGTHPWRPFSSGIFYPTSYVSYRICS
ncbi:MAG: hypothetical protein WC124_03405 [Desulfoplanes sp.]